MNIAILGYGIEGESVYNYYHDKFPDASFTAYDNNTEPKNPLPDGVKFVGGVEDFKGITADLAVKTPAIPPWKVHVSGQVTTATREFMQQCVAPIIGVTGTKGKGTTSSLIKSILDAAGKKTWLVGNIGIAALDVLDQISPDDVVIYELSSFQLWDIDISPHVAVILGIEPEHLDVHKDFEDYLHAKGHIAHYQKATDSVVYKYTNEFSQALAGLSAGQKVPYLDVSGAHIRGGDFYYTEQKMCSVSDLKIIGTHNAENACAAIAAVREWVQDGDIIAAGLRNFSGLPYRIELIRELNGVSYYNDSYSTAPAATEVALRAVTKPTILIAGGYDRGASYSDLAKKISEHPSIKKTLLIGQTKHKIAEGLKEGTFEFVDSLEETVQRAHDLASDGDAVVFSPGCASFDMFKDFTERGRQFTQLVESL